MGSRSTQERVWSHVAGHKPNTSPALSPEVED